MNHAQQAARFVADENRARWHNESVWSMRHNRDLSITSIEDWEILRERASQIKGHMLSKLADYLEQFESAVEQLGAMCTGQVMPSNTTKS